MDPSLLGPHLCPARKSAELFVQLGKRSMVCAQSRPALPILDETGHGQARFIRFPFFKVPNRLAIAFLVGLLLVQLLGLTVWWVSWLSYARRRCRLWCRWMKRSPGNRSLPTLENETPIFAWNSSRGITTLTRSKRFIPPLSAAVARSMTWCTWRRRRRLSNALLMPSLCQNSFETHKAGQS